MRVHCAEVDAEIGGDLRGQRRGLDSGGCGSRREGQHVFCHDDALIAGGGDLSEIEALLPGEFLGIGGGGHIGAGRTRGRSRCGGCAGSGGLRRGGSGRGGPVGDGLTGLTEPADRRLAGDGLALSYKDLQKHAVRFGLHIVGELIGGDRVDDIALVYFIAHFLFPFVDGAFGHGKAKLRH